MMRSQTLLACRIAAPMLIGEGDLTIISVGLPNKKQFGNAVGILLTASWVTVGAHTITV
jgi:hypothetical protein